MMTPLFENERKNFVKQKLSCDLLQTDTWQNVKSEPVKTGMSLTFVLQ